MPTGYTKCLGDGATFAEFASRCARAGMPLVSLQDEPLDAPLPDCIEPTQGYARDAAHYREQLALVERMSDEESDAAARKEFDEMARALDEIRAERERMRGVYCAALEEVALWCPPTPDHTFLKDFMREQILTSMRVDCPMGIHESAADAPSGAEWKARRIAHLRQEAEHYEAKAATAAERAAWATEWLRAFKASLRKENP